MFLKGYIRIKVSGQSIAAFINSCQKNGCLLYNVKKIMNVYFFDVESKNYKSVKSLAAEYGLETEINGRFGIMMKLILYKGRVAFFALAVLLSLYYGINSLFISEISINGNTVFTDNQIRQVLKENDLYVGRFKFGINPEHLQNEFIKDFGEISWIWLRIDGTHALVDVREKVTKPEFFDYNYHCNVVASRDGVITSAVASSGTLVVGEGMYVKKGDILINGVYDSTETAPVRFVNAGGKVYARTKYTIEDNFAQSFVRYRPQSELKTIYTPKIADIKLWDADTEDKSDIVLNDDDIKIRIFGKKYLPLAFTKTKYCEIIRNEYTLSETEAKDYAINELTGRLKLMLPEGAVVEKTEENIIPNSDGTFKATVTFECIEDIAAKLPIEVEAD